VSITLRVVLIVFALVFFFEIIKLVSRGKLQLKYSLLWMALSLVLLLCAIFPDLVGFFSGSLGIEAPSNLVFLIAIVALVGICLPYGNRELAVSRHQAAHTACRPPREAP